MRFIVLHSLQEYPLRQVETAVAATASQLGLVATGHGTHDQIWHTYGIIKRFIPGEVPAMQQARQQHGELHFDLINRLHVPIALGSMLFLLVLLANALVCRRFDAPARLAATVAVALLANALSAARCQGRTIATVRASPGLRLSPSLSPSCRRFRRSWASAEDALAAPSVRSVPLGHQIAAQPFRPRL
jgi:hypothetical protein